MLISHLIKAPTLGVNFIKFGPCLIQTASIKSRSTRGEPLKLHPPFPYQEKKFRWYHALFDNTMLRVGNENARVIVVEGPIGVGKSAFCKALAEELEMHYMPQPTMDEFYIFPSGFDRREIDHLVDDEVRTYDHKNFCTNPKTWKAALFQNSMLYLRFYQYLDALCHLLNTGQGVVLERSYYSDYIFMLAMHKSQYVSTELKNVYFTIKKNTSTFFLPPHLIIYLDIPVPVVQERIRTRNYSWEQNSPALTPQYLKNLEKFWKEDYLKEAKKNSEILIYNWTDGGDVDVVVDDIEKLEMDILRRDRKFQNWWITRDDLFTLRHTLTNKRTKFDQYFYYPWHFVNEVNVTQPQINHLHNVLSERPETKFDKGFNYLMGDKILSILFKRKEENYRAPKFHMNIVKPWDI